MSCFCRKTATFLLQSNTLRVFYRSAHAFDGGEVDPGSELHVGKFGSFTVFRINRPEKRNCLNLSTALQLKEALNNFNNDNYSSVGIICGEGGNFCSGLDCKELASDKNFYEKFVDIDLMGEFSRKPLVASVSGYAVGTGFDLALWCDLRVVEDTAVLGYLNRRIGMPVSDGSIRRLIQLVGKARAVDWVLTGKMVHSKEAFQAGIVSRLVACGTGILKTLSYQSMECYSKERNEHLVLGESKDMVARFEQRLLF